MIPRNQQIGIGKPKIHRTTTRDFVVGEPVKKPRPVEKPRATPQGIIRRKQPT